jgi:hypothetical protein
MSHLITPVADGSRRWFLRTAMAGATAAGAGAVLATPAEAAVPGTLPDLYPGWNDRNFRELFADEIAHSEIIQSLLNDPDNNVVPKFRPFPNFKNLLQPTMLAFAQTAAAIENTGVGVYIGILQAVLPTSQGGEYFETAAAIATIEGRHTGFLNTLLNMAVVPGHVAVDAPIDQNTALARIAPFIQDLNGGPPILPFSPTPTGDEDNDFKILDFLLVLEMLESVFYWQNVVRFFG